MIRGYRSEDRAAVYDVCVRTASAGGDARGRYVRDELPGDIWAGPYLELEPDLAFVVALPGRIPRVEPSTVPEPVHTPPVPAESPTTSAVPVAIEGTPPDSRGGEAAAELAGARVAGYILGTADTRRFVERYRAEWLPRFAERYTENDDTRAGFRPERMLIPEVDEYPAHLHIDLLPEVQRQGWGRALIRRFLAAAAERGAPGAHLGFDPANTGAAAFYERLGFRPLPSSTPSAPLYGIHTRAHL